MKLKSRFTPGFLFDKKRIFTHHKKQLMLSRILSFLLLLAILTPAYSQEPKSEAVVIKDLNNYAHELLLELDFKESLRHARAALKKAIVAKDDTNIAIAYNTIAGNYDELSENDKAIDNYLKALKHANAIKDDTLISVVNNNLGNMYFFEKHDHDKGLKHYTRSVEISTKLKDTAQVVFTTLNMSLAYFDLKKFDEGFKYLQYINTYQSKHGDPANEVFLLMVNGIYYSNKGDFKQADGYFQRGIALAKKLDQKLDLSYVYHEYSLHLERAGNHKEAYYYLSEYGKLKDTIYNIDVLRKADLEGVNLELDEYKRAIEKIAIEKENQTLSLRKSYIIVILCIVLLSILLLLLYMNHKSNKFRIKSYSELEVVNEELMIAKVKAEDASKLKTQFVSTISHELRTPLYGVVGITNMILDEHPELLDSPHLRSLKFSAKYLLSLVNDILQINKIEENRIVLENLLFNLTDEITTIKDSLQFIANRNKNILVTEIDTDIPEFLIGDKLRLGQILMNLISNALKFTTAGEVKITAELAGQEGSTLFVLFKIIDTGIGISPEDQQKIFEKFVQIERKEDDYQGTGLGLAIVSRLIELFGSEIKLESAAGVGSTFSFTIGFEHDLTKAQKIIDDIEVDLTSNDIYTILVVEDNKINQIVTKKILEKNNYKCYVVDDGFAALDLIQRQEFDVILMDINMPIINGFETTRRLRALGVTTPVVALTAFDQEEVTEEAISAGMNDIIIKPFEPIKLFQVINTQIKKKNVG